MVPAAGRGERLGAGVAKALRVVAGEPLLVHALRCLESGTSVLGGVVLCPSGLDADVRRAVRAGHLHTDWEVVVGGSTRQESVARGLDLVPAAASVLLVHDAARPCVPPDLVTRVLAAVRAGADGAVPAVPVADTVKRVDADGRVLGTPDRATLRQVQTPQGFRRSALLAAYAAPAAGSDAVTDDAGLVERAGGRVVVVDGDPRAFKVTGPLDLQLAEALLAR